MTGSQARVGALVVVALVLALGLWLRFADGDEEPGSASAGPRLSQDALIDRAQSSGATVYWIGPRDGVGYEFTTTPRGRAFVRYLPQGVDAGDPRPNFLTVATYPVSNGVSALRRAGRGEGAQLIELPSDALVYANREQPTSAYLARPGWRYEVEVYHPEPGEAMRLVLTGQVRQIR
jgi:hypothetical protein